MPTQKPKKTGPVRDLKLLATLSHLSILTIFILGPFCMGIPLIIWLMERSRSDASPLLEFQAKQAFFFQLALILVEAFLGIVVGILSLIVIGVLLIPLLVMLGLAGVVYGVYAGIQVSQEKEFRYFIIADLIQ